MVDGLVGTPGTLVPRATMVMAVIESLIWLIQPKWAATSPMTAVRRPMKNMDITKAGHPLHLSEQREKEKKSNMMVLFRDLRYIEGRTKSTVFQSTGNRGSEGNKSDGIDGILQVDEAAQVAGNITNHGSTETNHTD